jgi:tRNA (guanine10-N2)-dimethyltransferase
MYSYLLIFGNHPQLSLFEVKSVVQSLKISASVQLISSTVALLSVPEKINVEWWQNRLAGTIKIALVTDDVTADELLHALIKMCKPDKDRKFIFGISSYNLDKIKINDLGMKLKKHLVDSGIKTRFIVSRKKNLSSVIVSKNKLTSQGLEIILHGNANNKIMLASTLTVQDFSGFGQRDYNRPAVDAKNGLLPPKLARMMVNFSICQSDESLLDPFCGSGTVLQEALLMGYKKVFGSDISEKNLTNCRHNLEWLIKKNKTSYLSINNLSIKKADALRLSEVYSPESVGAVVCEPYLGPADKSNFIGQEKNIIKQLEEIYRAFILQATWVLKNGGRLVMVVPIINNQPLNYQPWLVDGFFIEVFPLALSLEQAKYSRPGQRVTRLIVVAEKNHC